MKNRYLFAVVLLASSLPGCGSGTGEITTDPTKLQPLTEAEKAVVKQQDESVAQEEGASYDFRKKPKAK